MVRIINTKYYTVRPRKNKTGNISYLFHYNEIIYKV